MYSQRSRESLFLAHSCPSVSEKMPTRCHIQPLLLTAGNNSKLKLNIYLLQ
nr:MAG TPA: hypothetical protein [Bacteriophage sp.]